MTWKHPKQCSSHCDMHGPFLALAGAYGHTYDEIHMYDHIWEHHDDLLDQENLACFTNRIPCPLVWHLTQSSKVAG